MDGFPKFNAKSILSGPDDFAFQLKAAAFSIRGYSNRYDITFGQKQIGFDESAFAAQVFNETFVYAVSSSKK